ncbi:MAG: hypothetical protein Q4Q04_06935, partial [Methanocorpusculum sp.]|nr:hypothetical protein [Methanocorpusculum sp.]
MRTFVPAVVLSAAAVLGASPQTYAAAGICAVLYLVFSLLPFKEPAARTVLLAAVGLPLILAAGYAVTAGISAALLLISLLSFTDALSRKTAVLSVLAGIA